MVGITEAVPTMGLTSPKYQTSFCSSHKTALNLCGYHNKCSSLPQVYFILYTMQCLFILHISMHDILIDLVSDFLQFIALV